MTQIKNFWKEDSNEENINKWLREQADKIKVISIFDRDIGICVVYEEVSNG
jgi:hypothetical protein